MDEALIKIAENSPWAAAMVFIAALAYVYFFIRLLLIASGVIRGKEF